MPNVMVDIYNFSTWQAETRESQVQSQAELNSESEAKLGCIYSRPYLEGRGKSEATIAPLGKGNPLFELWKTGCGFCWSPDTT